MTEQTITTGIIQEEWRSISGYMNYQVSNVGRIRNIDTGRILKPGTNTTGYLQIWLCKEQIYKFYCVHRLVAQEFIENPENKSCVDHIDLNKQNNNITNLRWASRSENDRNIKKIRNTCSSKFKGVSYHEPSQKYRARIHIGTGATIYLGYFLMRLTLQERTIKKQHNDLVHLLI